MTIKDKLALGYLIGMGAVIVVGQIWVSLDEADTDPGDSRLLWFGASAFWGLVAAVFVMWFLLAYFPRAVRAQLRKRWPLAPHRPLLPRGLVPLCEQCGQPSDCSPPTENVVQR